MTITDDCYCGCSYSGLELPLHYTTAADAAA
jgi:hypothetical protein